MVNLRYLRKYNRRGAVLLGLLILLLTGCSANSKIKLADIPADRIPEKIRQETLVSEFMGGPVQDFHWRVFSEVNDQVFVVATWTQTITPPVPQATPVTISFVDYNIFVPLPGEGYKLITGGGGNLPEEGSFAIVSKGLARHEQDGQEELYLHADGISFKSAIKEVIGVTSEGREVSFTPIDGFWHLGIKTLHFNESWQEIVAKNNQGKVLFRQ